jgi:hypothetical protein
VPLNSSFGHKTPQDQDDITAELQAHASGAGLAGTVFPVWDAGGGRMAFKAPPNWHPFFRSLSLHSVHANINKEIYWQ